MFRLNQHQLDRTVWLVDWKRFKINDGLMVALSLSVGLSVSSHERLTQFLSHTSLMADPPMNDYTVSTVAITGPTAGPTTITTTTAPTNLDYLLNAIRILRMEMKEAIDGQKWIGTQRLADLCEQVRTACFLLPDENLGIARSLLSTGNVRVIPRVMQALDRFLATS